MWMIGENPGRVGFYFCQECTDTVADDEKVIKLRLGKGGLPTVTLTRPLKLANQRERQTV